MRRKRIAGLRIPDLGPCPRCGSAQVVPIAYGYMPRGSTAGRLGLADSGGCVVEGDNRACHCCGWRWGPDEPLTWLNPT